MPPYTEHMGYSAEHKALVVAAVERYGERAGLRLVAENYDLNPSRATVHAWIREQGLVPTDEARQEIGELEQQRKARLQAGIDARIPLALEAFDKACDAGSYLGMQQAATAVGILYDKLVPPPRAGVTVNAGGDRPAIQLLVVAPSSRDEEHRPVIEGEARELPAEDGRTVGEPAPVV